MTNILPKTLNYGAVKNDGQLHAIWQKGNVTVKGFSGEFGRISLHVFIGDAPWMCTYNPRTIEDFIQEMILDGRANLV